MTPAEQKLFDTFGDLCVQREHPDLACYGKTCMCLVCISFDSGCGRIRLKDVCKMCIRLGSVSQEDEVRLYSCPMRGDFHPATLEELIVAKVRYRLRGPGGSR